MRDHVRDFGRRFLIGLLAVLFAASSVAAQQCAAAHHTTAPAAAAPAITADHAHHDHAAHDGAQAHHADSAAVHQHASGGTAPLADDHACNKCCGVCTLATAMPSDARSAVIFAVSPASFSDTADPLVGTTVQVDPGIPKRTS